MVPFIILRRLNRTVADAIAEAVYDAVPNAYLYGLCNSELLLRGIKSA